MKGWKWGIAVMVAILVLQFGISVCSAQGEAVKASRSTWSMFYLAHFSNLIGFVDMATIWVCSLASIGLIVEHSLTIRRVAITPDVTVAQIKTMFDERRFREALEYCQNDPSFLAGVLHAGLVQAASGYEAMENALQDATNERMARLYRKVEWLNLIGNVTPMMGLTGTVWGMMTAFTEIEAKGGKANPSDLAGGILIALVSTFMGLLTAVPALTAYGVFRSRVEQMSMEAALVAEELLASFKPVAA